MFQVVYGGSASGKSAYAESMVTDRAWEGAGQAPALIYIATMYPFDEECRKRIQKHRAMRAEKQFETVECYTGLKQIEIPKQASVLLECMSNLAANERYGKEGAKARAVEEILEGVRHLMKRAGHLVVVTNDVFCDGEEYDPDTMAYLRELGAINEAMGAWADEVIEVVYGIPIVQKGAGR